MRLVYGKVIRVEHDQENQRSKVVLDAKEQESLLSYNIEQTVKNDLYMLRYRDYMSKSEFLDEASSKMFGFYENTHIILEYNPDIECDDIICSKPDIVSVSDLLSSEAFPKWSHFDTGPENNVVYWSIKKMEAFWPLYKDEEVEVLNWGF